MRKIGNKGFTLVEMIVVIVIIGIISASGVSMITHYMRTRSSYTLDMIKSGLDTMRVKAIANPVNSISFEFFPGGDSYRINCMTSDSRGTIAVFENYFAGDSEEPMTIVFPDLNKSYIMSKIQSMRFELIANSDGSCNRMYVEGNFITAEYLTVSDFEIHSGEYDKVLYYSAATGRCDIR